MVVDLPWMCCPSPGAAKLRGRWPSGLEQLSELRTKRQGEMALGQNKGPWNSQWNHAICKYPTPGFVRWCKIFLLGCSCHISILATAASNLPTPGCNCILLVPPFIFCQDVPPTTKCPSPSCVRLTPLDPVLLCTTNSGMASTDFVWWLDWLGCLSGDDGCLEWACCWVCSF